MEEENGLAQGPDAGQPTEPRQEPAGGAGGKPQEPQAKYTDADVDAIVEKKLAKWKRQEEAKVAEAARLAEMNATQKAEYERDQLQRRLDELERDREVAEMVAESRRQLSGRGVSVPDELVARLVGETAEETKATVDAFADAYVEAVEAGVRQRLSGTAPKSGGAAKALSRDEIMAIKDTAQRQRAIAEHPEYFFNRQ